MIFEYFGTLFRNFRFRFQNFIQQNEDGPVAGPSGQDLDEAMVIDDDDDFFATADRLSQEEEEDQPTQGLLGLDGPVTPLKIELDRFLHMPKPANSKVDILAWWKDHQQTLPLLAACARKYLCITASSASAERLFSASGKVITPLRSSLDPANVDKMVYLHENLKEVEIKYDFSLAQPQAQAQPADPDDPDEVVVVA